MSSKQTTGTSWLFLVWMCHDKKWTESRRIREFWKLSFSLVFHPTQHTSDQITRKFGNIISFVYPFEREGKSLSTSLVLFKPYSQKAYFMKYFIRIENFSLYSFSLNVSNNKLYNLLYHHQLPFHCSRKQYAQKIVYFHPIFSWITLHDSDWIAKKKPYTLSRTPLLCVRMRICR